MSIINKISYNQPKLQTTNIDPCFKKWIDRGRERIFSLAAGNRVAAIAPRIMEIGLGKILYATETLGIDTQNNQSFCLFAPDGTVSYNPIRTKRGFSYGCILHLDFDGLLATSNSMPNGCGFSMYELENPPEDNHLCNYLADTQMRLGQDQLSQLGKGNHFAGLYYVLDPLSGEDTHRRFVVIHCSGHEGGHKLYHPSSWLGEYDGYHTVQTPHGPVTLLENHAKGEYLQQYKETDRANSSNRDLTMEEIFNHQYNWKKIQSITHQGLKDDGLRHIIGCQIDKGLVPIAFNPEEGLIGVKAKENLSPSFLSTWDEADRINELGIKKEMQRLNFTPHGGGYEFRFPLDSVEIRLNREGIASFLISFRNRPEKMKFTYFREVREWMSFRRKFPILEKIVKADLATVKYEMPCLMQIYPLVSIPGGTH